MKTLRLKLSIDELAQRFAGVDHQRFQSALPEHWQTVDGCATGQSVCWLFCWATTGMGSPTAVSQTGNIFDVAFCDFKFDEFDKKVGYPWAQEHRYASENIDAEVIKLLNVTSQSQSGATS